MMQKTVPNVLSLIRLACVPVLLWLAWSGHPHWFLAVLIFAFFTDAVDGFIARRFDQKTSLGAKLDSYADGGVYLALAISVFWLWPGIVATEKLYIGFVVASVIVPTVIGYLKFGTLTSYHTWLVKTSAICTALSSILLIMEGPAWPFRIASVLCLIAALEDIIITLYLSKPKTNVKSIWHLKKQKNLTTGNTGSTGN